MTGGAFWFSACLRGSALAEREVDVRVLVGSGCPASRCDGSRSSIHWSTAATSCRSGVTTQVSVRQPAINDQTRATKSTQRNFEVAPRFHKAIVFSTRVGGMAFKCRAEYSCALRSARKAAGICGELARLVGGPRAYIFTEYFCYRCCIWRRELLRERLSFPTNRHRRH